MSFDDNIRLGVEIRGKLILTFLQSYNMVANLNFGPSVPPFIRRLFVVAFFSLFVLLSSVMSVDYLSLRADKQQLCWWYIGCAVRCGPVEQEKSAELLMQQFFFYADNFQCFPNGCMKRSVSAFPCGHL